MLDLVHGRSWKSGRLTKIHGHQAQNLGGEFDDLVRGVPVRFHFVVETAGEDRTRALPLLNLGHFLLGSQSFHSSNSQLRTLGVTANHGCVPDRDGRRMVRRPLVARLAASAVPTAAFRSPNRDPPCAIDVTPYNFTCFLCIALRVLDAFVGTRSRGKRVPVLHAVQKFWTSFQRMGVVAHHRPATGLRASAFPGSDGDSIFSYYRQESL